jgi:hypothetical protein
MGYKVITIEKIYEVFRRWHSGQNIRWISTVEGLDRKTVRGYIEKLQKKGYNQGKPFPTSEELYPVIAGIIPGKQRNKRCASILDDHIEAITFLIQNPNNQEAVLPKTAYEIITERHNLKVSYSTFKRFISDRGIKKKPGKTGIRIELEPGRETQIDYGKVGLLMHPESGKNRVVYAYCGTLSCSRLPYIEYTYTQNQVSFTGTTINMFEFFEGVTETVSIDNLKSGVIKPDLYDPSLNRAFSEMACHYDVFIDPCRVATPQDKGKIERMIPVARELFRKLKHLHPSADIHELNRLAREWCKNEYGMREHGTTKQAPLVVFEEIEKPTLKPLPVERFDVPRWKKATVHPDQFFAFEKKLYSLPSKYVGKEVWIRHSGAILRVFYEHVLIREYISKNLYMNYEPKDFPEVVREMMDGGYPRYLIKQAKRYGDIPARFIESVLQPHAYLNARRAQGMLRMMEQFSHKSFFTDVCQTALNRRVKLPRTFKEMLNHEDGQLTLDLLVPMSDEGLSMVRDIEDIFM